MNDETVRPLDPGARREAEPPAAWVARDPAGFLVAHLRLLDDVAAGVCRARRASPHEIEELAALGRLRLVEHDYRVLRRFRGGRSLRAYLRTVLDRLLLDMRSRQWGRWRPSRAARRAGHEAVRFETLVRRDRWSRDEAGGLLGEARDHALRAQLAELAERAAARSARRASAGGALLVAGSTSTGAAEATALGRERDLLRARLRRALSGAIQALPPDDALLLRLRFDQARSVPSIAADLGRDPKALYRRLAAVLRGLRAQLERQQVARADVLGALDADEPLGELALFAPASDDGARGH